jgi:ATP-binding cassette, subfamily C, bacterial
MRSHQITYTWKSIFRIALRHKKTLIAAHVIAVFAALVSVPIPLLLPLMVDEVLLQQPAGAIDAMNAILPVEWRSATFYLAIMLLVTLVLRLISLLLGVWQMRQFTFISKDIVFHIRQRLLLRLQKVSMSEYETLGSGKVASHLVTDLDTIDLFIGSSISRFLVALLSIIGIAAVLLYIHWPLAIFILCLNPVVIYLTTVMGKKVKKLKKNENSAYELFQESLSETLDAMLEIRAANRDNYYISRIIENARAIKKRSSTYTWKSDAAQRLSIVTFLFGFDIFRAISMLMVVYSDLSIGLMFAVFGYLWFMMTPVQELLGIQYAYHSANAALDRVNNLLKIPQEPVYPNTTNPFSQTHTPSIEIKNISFCYANGKSVLNDISFKINAGEKVALVGASGSGKTTLVQVLLGLYTPTSGSILFNGVDYQEIGLNVIRENMATVLQHPALFNDSVRMNLTLGANYSDESLWKALDVAQLSDVIHPLPDGLNSSVGKNGIRLSGGQRQRLAIARVILTEPKAVIMDESTSSLDTKTEMALHQAMQTFLTNRTTLIIAHRLSAIKQADRILVFDKGKIVEQGNHGDLMGLDGLYTKLYKEKA